MDLNALKIIVTGGANGMGRYFAERMHHAGASVAVGDIDENGLSSLDDGIYRRQLDVTNEKDCETFVGWADNVLGGVNGLINNAGIIQDGLLVKSSRRTGEVSKQPMSQIRAVIDVNLLGATMMVRETVAKMAAAKRRGVIINMSSISRYGNRGQSAYVSAKAALAANTVTWAREFQRFGIRVVAIAPGMVETPMTANMNQAALDTITQRIPVGRIGHPEDIWLGVKFALECEYFNGKTIDIDGGLSF